MSADEPRADALTPEQANSTRALLEGWRATLYGEPFGDGPITRDAARSLLGLAESLYDYATERQAAETAALRSVVEAAQRWHRATQLAAWDATRHLTEVDHRARLEAHEQAIADLMHAVDALAATQPAPEPEPQP